MANGPDNFESNPSSRSRNGNKIKLEEKMGMRVKLENTKLKITNIGSLRLPSLKVAPSAKFQSLKLQCSKCLNLQVKITAFVKMVSQLKIK
jgi:hypothetical protein